MSFKRKQIENESESKNWLGILALSVFFRLTMVLLITPSIFAATEKKVSLKMGSRFEITAVHQNSEIARQAIDAAYAEIDRLESIISSWRSHSATSDVNHAAGRRAVEVPEELFNLIRRAQKVSVLTDGAFDITYDGFGKLWDFKSDVPVIPSTGQIEKALDLVGYQNIILNPERKTVFLKKAGMKLGFGAIGKGYAANRAVFTLKKFGVTGGVVNAGGDMVLFGNPEYGDLWEVGITHPRDPKRVYARLKLTEQAVVTSGDYENYFFHKGKRFAHILNPKTGYPVDFLQSVTVICPDGELADALATAVFVLGQEKGLSLVNKLKGVACMIIDADGNRFHTENLKKFLNKSEEMQ